MPIPLLKTVASRQPRESRSRAARTLRTVLWLQVMIMLLAAGGAAVLAGPKAGWSALVGAGIGTVVTLYFASKVFAARPGASADKVARAFFVGEVVKWVLTVVLFAVAIVALDAAFLPMIIAYMASLAAYWLALPLTQ